MRTNSRYTLAVALAGLMLTGSGLTVMGCGSGGGTGTGGGSAGTGGGGGGSGGGSSGFTQPTGTVAVNFTVDDTANKVFGAGELQWKGSMKYDSATRKVTYDSTWGGPYAPLYDDGPWSAGGHEPAGSTAGDHKWGVTVFIVPPATGTQDYGYGTIDVLNQGWIWRGTDGKFTVTAGTFTEITAAPLTLLPFGTTNLKLVVNPQGLSDAGTWDTSKIEVKGSAWGWVLKTAGADAGTPYTFTLSDWTGKAELKHAGLLSSGDKPEFVFQMSDVEYKDSSQNCLATGITAYLSTADGGWAVAPITVNSGNKNTLVTVP